MSISTVWMDKARDPSWLGRAFVISLAVLAFAIQIVSIYLDITWHTLYTSDVSKVNPDLAVIKVGPDLAITGLRPGAEEAGFKIGDRLLRLGGQEISTILEYRAAQNRQPANAWITVEVQRGDETIELSMLVKRKQQDLRFVIRNLISAGFIVLGTLVALQRFGDKAARLFFLVSLALGLYFALLNKEVPILVYIQVFVLTLASGLTLHFFLTFPRDRLSSGFWWVLLYVPSLILMILTMQAFSESLLMGNGIWFAPRYEMLLNISFAYLAFCATIALASMGYVYATTADSVEKRQLQWIMWGLVFAIVASIVDIVLTLTRMHTSPIVSDLLLLGTLALPVSLAFAILRYRLLDIDLVVNRSVVYALLTATLVALYLLLIGVFSTALGIAAGSANYTVVVFLSALVIGILANPLRRHVQAIIDRLFFRQQVDYQRALINWSQELSTSIRFSDVTQLLIHEVPQQLMIADARLLVLNEEETQLAALPAWGDGHEEKWAVASRLKISAQSAAAASLLRPGKVILLAEAGTGPVSAESLDLQAAQGIPLSWKDAGVQVVLPLVSGGQLVGVYLLGPKLSGDIYQRRELDLLRTLSNQAAIAIANARLYEQVHAFSQEMEEKVQDRTQELRDFVSAVYHELSTPITAIRGYTSLLLDEKAGPLHVKQERYLQIIRRNIRRLLGLVGDLSDVSKIEDGRLTIHPEPVLLREAVDETVLALSGIIEEKGLQVDVTLDSDVGVVLGDPQRVVQILTNLVSNACRYTPAGGQIAIAANRVNGSAEMTVQDSGIGIQKEDLERIFDRFYRSKDPLVREQSGTGLGLAITKSLVELHGGDLWVNSQVGKGSTFGFKLPLAEVIDEQ